MGSLIMTRGTRRLIHHYNTEFSDWMAFYRQPQIVSLFDRNKQDIKIWKDLVNYVTDPNGPTTGHTSDPDDPTLLPPKDPKHHKNLWRRWKFFLENILNPTNQNKLADAIHDALTDSGNPPYILFDVRQGSNQDIIVSSLSDTGHAIPQITIQVMDAMPAHPSTSGGDDPPDIDDQHP